MDLKAKISAEFGGKIRIRVCGLLVIDRKLLLVKHRGVGDLDYLWAPPGGGVNFGENINNALVREIKEETGINCQVEKFSTINEFITPPFHAIELFYYVGTENIPEIKIGHDPELDENQIISDVRFFGIEDLLKIPTDARHDIIKAEGDILNVINRNHHV